LLNVIDPHDLASLELGIAEMAAQVAASEPDEYGRLPSVRTFALNRAEDRMHGEQLAL
jgi:hypothetical protein